MEQIVNKVEKQEIEITYIKKTLDELVEQNKKQSEQLVKISESIQKQEIILEKIGNLEDKYNDGIKRCHRRIDEELERCKVDKERMEHELETLKNDLSRKPCNNYGIFQKELDQVKAEIAKHGKVIWWGATLIIGAVIVAILKEHFH